VTRLPPGEFGLTAPPFAAMETSSVRPTAQFWDRMLKEGKDQILNILDVDVPVVAALKGNAFIHAEVITLSDIVVAAEGARLADKAHTCIGIPPSDGVHVIWTMLLGNRARHFLLSGAEIDATEAQRLGVVAEVVPKDLVLERARAIARELAQKPRLTLRYARLALTQDLKRRLVNDLGHGLALLGLGVLGMVEETAQAAAGRDPSSR
jgi:enoyl-CoA hydratase/carnithine racemase